MFNFDHEAIKRRVGIVMDGVWDIYKKLLEDRKQKTEGPNEESREHAVQNFTKNESNIPYDESHEKSMKDSQGVKGFTGSAYNGKGGVQFDKTHTNKWQRNFENHQGN